MSKSFYIFLGGVVAGLLIAPQKGSVTREKISKLGADAKDKWKSLKGTIEKNDGEEEDMLIAIVEPS